MSFNLTNLHCLTDRMDYIEITDEILDVNKISQMVTDPSCGAVSIFVGK